MGKFSKQETVKSKPSGTASQSPVLLIVGGIILVIVVFFLFFNKPSYPEINSPRPFLGNSNAQIVIEEFSDFECPACQTAAPFVKSIITEFKDDVRFEYKHFPLNNECNSEMSGALHLNACIAAYASECANDQNKFWEYHDYNFANKKVDEASLRSTASAIGLDMELFNACLDSRAKRNVVVADIQNGNSRNVNATPTFFVNGEKIENWNNLRSIIIAKKAQLSQ